MQVFPGAGDAILRPPIPTEFRMKLFPQEKQKLDLFGLFTRKERSPWMERFYLCVSLAFFGWLIYRTWFAD